jgi:hypothetical protein
MVVITLFAAVGIAVFNRYPLDGVWGGLYAGIGAAPTEFPPSYSDQGFRLIKIGMTPAEVQDIVGLPWIITLRYPQSAQSRFVNFNAVGEKRAVYASGVSWENVSESPLSLGPSAIGYQVANGLTMSEVTRRLGSPAAEQWSYGRSPTTSPFRSRVVSFIDGRVDRLYHGVNW